MAETQKNITPHNPLEGPKPEMSLDLHKATEAQISIIVVHKDKPAYLNICLQSIAVTSFNNNYEIIVVDNGSGQETQEFLDELEDEIKVIRNEKNAYWSAACNQGVAAADENSTYYIFLHCDVVVTNPGWLDYLVTASEARQAGLVGCELGDYFMAGQPVSFIQEYCLLMTKECWKDIGPWPESLPQIGPAFVMTLKAQTSGQQPQCMNNNIVHHYGVFSLNINEYEKLIEDAMAELPKLVTDIQTQPVENKVVLNK